MSRSFSGRIALVTGAARGLGRAATARLYENGASVAVNVRDAERASHVAASLGERALAVPGDIDTDLTQEHATPDLLERLAAGYPIPRLGTAGEVADLICFVASESAGYITGASFDINGGDLMM